MNVCAFNKEIKDYVLRKKKNMSICKKKNLMKSQEFD